MHHSACCRALDRGMVCRLMRLAAEGGRLTSVRWPLWIASAMASCVRAHLRGVLVAEHDGQPSLGCMCV